MKTVIRKFAVDLRIRVGYGTAFLLLLLSYVLTLYANSELLKQAHLVDNSNKIILQIEGLISSLKDAETGMRGYLLMKDESFLNPYEQSKQGTDSIFRLLWDETLNDPDRQISMTTLGGLIKKKYELMDSSLSNYKRHDYRMTDRIALKGYFDKEIMERIRSTVKQIYNREQTRLKERSDEMTARYYALNTIIITSLVLAVLMAVYAFLTYSRENKARREADERVFEYQEQLKQRILELDKANKELIQMRSIEKFASTGRIARTIAHEVRNPLTNINLAVDQLKTDLNGNLPENYGVMLDMISRNSLRINQLITDLLNSTKFTELVYKRISVNQLLDETLELAEDRIRLNSITVTKNYAGDICDVAVDVERMRIAFLNLIVNAIEAMEPGKGILQLKTLSKDNKCMVIITDNGPGIDKESQSKLFEAYFTTKSKGTGLGLTNTQNIILNHSGHINMESEVGKGTSFMITLDFA
ncbi:MAG TPA: CHASE3 domain-containing protein [Puia sp.]|nr:CHASE3 domain-containing protein [Puia sp.]